MVKGLDIFKEYFQDYPDNYIIIGGSACDVIIEEQGLTPRATDDIDMILVVEALSKEFVKQFWKFIEDGNYERKEKNEDDRKYYRFLERQNLNFPVQIELFSRNPDLMDLDEGTDLTPIPVDDDLTSLSAILLDEEYYKYLREHSFFINGIHLANNEALICLKARAYLDLVSRKADSRKIKKQKGDVFRMTALLTEEEKFELPASIKKDMQQFVNDIEDNLPGKEMFKRMGISAIDPQKVLMQLKNSFLLK